MTKMRINKYIASVLGFSRRKTDEMIEHGRVMVNGKPARLGTIIDDVEDKITLDDAVVKRKNQKHTYIMFYKPIHVITTRSDEKHRDTITDMLPEKLKMLKPAGRLDFETEGLLILTDDGDFINYLTHPENNVNKKYAATVFGNVSHAEAERMKKGIVIRDEKYQLNDVKLVHYNPQKDKSNVEIDLSHGKKHEIRNIMKAFGHPVITLKRICIGNITIRGMKPGTYRHFDREEFKPQV